MAAKVDFIQILYNESQRAELYPIARPYFSVGLTPYFENAIIAGVVPTLQAEHIGVASWRLRFKRTQSHVPIITGGADITEERIVEKDADVCILTPHRPNHKPLAMASNWHGKAWDNAFGIFKGFIRSQGIKIPDELTYTIYENHFIARREIYHAYVRDCLIPACDFVSRDDVFYAPSGYNNKKRDEVEKKRVHRLLGSDDWPIMPFILERLFSIYIQDKRYKVEPL